MRPHPDLEHIDNAFFKILADPEELENQVDDIEVRDAFLQFMSSMMKNYKNYIKDPGMTRNGLVNDHAGSRDFFNFDKFRADKDASKPFSFIYKMTETTNFGSFIESRSLGKMDNDEQIMFFDKISKMARNKTKKFLIEPFEPNRTVKAE